MPASRYMADNRQRNLDWWVGSQTLRRTKGEEFRLRILDSWSFYLLNYPLNSLRLGRLQPRKFKRAISQALIVVLLAALVAIGSTITIIILADPFQCLNGCSVPMQGITIQSGNFYYNSRQFNFSISNTGSNTIISNVTISSIPCNGDFPPLKSNAVTFLSCTVSGATFTHGEIVNYVINANNGQSIYGKFTAQWQIA